LVAGEEDGGFDAFDGFVGEVAQADEPEVPAHAPNDIGTGQPPSGQIIFLPAAPVPPPASPPIIVTEPLRGEWKDDQGLNLLDRLIARKKAREAQIVA
jgi:hypothetical protein